MYVETDNWDEGVYRTDDSTLDGTRLPSIPGVRDASTSGVRIRTVGDEVSVAGEDGITSLCVRNTDDCDVDRTERKFRRVGVLLVGRSVIALAVALAGTCTPSLSRNDGTLPIRPTPTDINPPTWIPED